MNSRQVNLKMQASKLLLCGAILIQLFVAQRSESPWQTLSGEAPRVIARGGISGLFPDSSLDAYKFAISTSVAGAVLWCDVHLTKDGVGICFPDLNLANASNIQDVYPSRQKTYPVNGVPTQGWFTIGRNKYAISTIQNVATVVKPEGFWLNVQNDAFYAQQNLNITSFLLSVSKTVRKIYGRFGCIGPNFVFQFLGLDDFELTTNRTYYYILDDLRFVKTFASGILVPKSYIWPLYQNIHICK